MAAKTFTYGGVDHNWTTPGNWNLGTLPVDNDSVTIPINETCTFNADMSSTGTWPNGIAGITIGSNAVLNCTDTAGSYYLKIKASNSINGTGTLTWGSTTFTAKHTLAGGTNWSISYSTSLTLNVIGAEPTYKYVRLLNAEGIGDTRLEIDTNLTGDIWANTDTITVNNINKGKDCEERIIQAITSTYIDISVGLTATKLSGSYICLMTRNTKIIQTPASTATLITNFVAGKCNISGGQFIGVSGAYCFNACSITISGGTFYGFSYVSYATGGVGTASISGGVFSGNLASIINAGVDITVSGGSFIGNTGPVMAYYTGLTVTAGLFAGNGVGFQYGGSLLVTGGTYIGHATIFSVASGVIITGGTFSNNTNFIYASQVVARGCILDTVNVNTYCMRRSIVTLLGVTIPTGTTVIDYTTMPITNYMEAYDDAILGDYKSWSKGGITTTVTSPVPSGFTKAYQLTLANASYAAFWQKKVLAPAGKTVSFVFYISKSVSMAYKPRAWVFLESIEPFILGTPLKEFIFPDDDNDVWETDTYTYTNVDTYDKTLVVRFLGKNASGNVYTQLATNYSMSPRSRVLGGVG